MRYYTPRPKERSTNRIPGRLAAIEFLLAELFKEKFQHSESETNIEEAEKILRKFSDKLSFRYPTTRFAALDTTARILDTALGSNRLEE